MLSYLSLYHRYSVICIRNNIHCEELKSTSNQLEKQIQLYSFHRGRHSILNEPNTSSFLRSWKSLTYSSPCNHMTRKLCLKTCVHIICPFLEDFDPSCGTPWEPVGNQECWEESHFFLGRWQNLHRRVIICCFSSCFFPAMLGFWRMYLLVYISQHLGSSILTPLGFYCKVLHINWCNNSNTLAVLVCMCSTRVCTKDRHVQRHKSSLLQAHFKDKYPREITAVSCSILVKKTPKTWVSLGQNTAELQEYRFY